MGATEEYFRLLMEVKGDAALADLEQQLKGVAAEEAKLKAQFDGNSISADRLESELRRLAATNARLKETSTGVASGLGKYQQNIMGLSYAMNDFFGASGGLDQRLNGMANNLPMLLTGLGNWGYALSGVVPVIAMVYKNWDSLTAAFGLGAEAVGNHLETLKKRVEELEAKPVRLAVETAELERARKEVQAIKAALDAVEALKKSQAYYEKESGGQVEGIITEAKGGAQGVNADLHRYISQTLQARDPSLQEARRKQAELKPEIDRLKPEIDRLKAVAENGPAHLRAAAAQELAALTGEWDAAVEKAKQIVAKIDGEGGEAEQMAGRLFDRSMKGSGPEQAGAQKNLAGWLRGAGRGDVARQIEAVSPEKLQAEDRADADFDAGLDRTKDRAGLDREKDRIRKHEATQAASQFPAGEKEDMKAGALRAIQAGHDRGEVQEAVAANVRAKLDEADDVAEGLRDEVAAHLAEKIVGGVSGGDVKRANEADAKKNATLAHKADVQAHKDAVRGAKVQERHDKEAAVRDDDEADLAKGLGDVFVGQAEYVRLGIEQMSGAQRKQAMAEFRRKFSHEAEQRLLRSGVDPRRAGALANQANTFIERDINAQTGRARAMGATGSDREVRQGLRGVIGQNLMEQQARTMAAMVDNQQALAGRLRANEVVLNDLQRRAAQQASMNRRTQPNFNHGSST